MKNELAEDEVFLLQMPHTFMLLFFRNQGHTAEMEKSQCRYY